MIPFLKRWGARFIGVALFIFFLFKFDFGTIGSHLAKFTLSHIGILGSMTFLFLLTKSLRWWVLLKQYGVDIPFFSSFSIYLAGMFLGLVTPGRIGDFSKAFYLKTYHNLILFRGLLISVIDRLLDLLLMLLISYLYITLVVRGVSLILSVGVLLIGFLLLGIVFWTNRKSSLLQTGLVRTLRWLSHQKLDTTTFERYTIYPMNRFSGLAVVLTLVSMIVLVYQAYRIAGILGLNIAFVTTGGSLVSANLVGLLPISIMGVGTRELTLFAFLDQIPYAAIIGFSVSFVIFSQILSAIVGFLCWVCIDFNKG
jgi:uncharacterized protein (TIRG00374 family)